MARPTKAVVTLDRFSQTKAELATRLQNENKLKGGSDMLVAPSYFNEKQNELWDYIVDQLSAAELLGNLDVFILTSCVIAIDRLQHIEELINKDIGNLYNKDLMASKDKYTKDLFRCCSELSLSPQSRAKLANVNVCANEKKKDPLLKALGK